MKAAGAALVVFAAVWFIVPPMISDTPVLIRPLERMIGRTFGVRCDIQHARLTLATGWPTISISTMDVYRRDSDAFLAFVDSVDAEFVLWRLLIGSVKTRSMTIARIEVDAPFARLHHFFMQRGFLSHPVMNEASDTAREFLRFEDVRAAIFSRRGVWSVTLDGGCDSPLARDGRFSLEFSHDAASQKTVVKRFEIAGVRSFQQSRISGMKFEQSAVETPVSFGAAGTAAPGYLDFPSISFALGPCNGTASVRAIDTNIIFALDMDEQDIDDIGRVVRTREGSNTLTGFSFHLKSETERKSGLLISDGTLRVRGGLIRSVPFKDAMVKFQLHNDRLISFTGNAGVWNGRTHVILLDNEGASADGVASTNRSLLGTVSASDLDLNACLGALELLPARTGGDVSMMLSFDVDNMGIAGMFTRTGELLGRMHGGGEIIFSNAFLEFFGSDQWQLSPRVPAVVKNYLALSARLVGASSSVPLLNRVVRDAGLNAPRTLATHVSFEEGVITTPEVRASTPFGDVYANGRCTEDGRISYRVTLQLARELDRKYGDHPLLALFRTNDVVQVPVRLSGTIAQPRVEMDLSAGEKADLEDRMMEIVAAYIDGHVRKGKDGAAPGARDATPGEPSAQPPKHDMKQLEGTLRDLIRRLL